MRDFGIVDISTRVRNEVEKTIEGELLKATAEIGVSVDRIRLFKALTEARTFYDDGYEAGLRDAVRHGRWEDHMVRDWRCSECGKRVPKQVRFDGYCYNDKLAYCPHYGAKMDGNT